MYYSSGCSAEYIKYLFLEDKYIQVINIYTHSRDQHCIAGKAAIRLFRVNIYSYIKTTLVDIRVDSTSKSRT